MADNVLTNVRVTTLHDTEANWTANDPVLLVGELGYVTDGNHKGLYKMGDGTSRFSQLSWCTEPFSATEKTKLSGIESGAQKNVNGIGTVTIYGAGSSAASTGSLAANKANASIALATGENVKFVLDTKEGIPLMTISATDTTYNDVTQSAHGLMTAADKTKLDGIAAGANNYVHPKSGVTAGTYKSVTVDANGHVTAGTNPTTLSGYGIIDAASKSHTHQSADIVSLDASKLTGTISIDRLPKGALERLYVCKDDDARLKLTNAEVQNGDTVKVESTGKMYFVVDDSKLTTEEGYAVYTAGTATSVPWSGVTGKPTTFTPAVHKHVKADITDFPTTMKNPTSAIIKLNGGTTEGTNMFTYDGSAAKTINITPASIGASASGHTHNYAGSATAGGAANSVANAVTVQFNGGSVDGTSKFVFNGSAAKTINITPAGIGAAAANHGTHVTFSTDAPKADGTAAAGTSTAVARADHVHPITPNATTEANGLMSSADKVKLNGIEAGANKYIHPTTAGNKHIPAGGKTGQFLKYASNGTAVWADIPAYSIATTSVAGIVKASTAANQINVDSTGLMTVNSLSTDKLITGTNTLVLDCGTSAR